jgi:hypothetical protein
MHPRPATALTVYGAGMHEYTKAEPDLPMGVAPAVLADWERAVESGFFGIGTQGAGEPTTASRPHEPHHD